MVHSCKMASVLVTGANRGIGLEFVRQLVGKTDSNWKHVFAGCRSPDEAESLKKLARSSNPAVRVVELDISNDATIEAAMEQVSAVIGGRGLNVLINNAGIYNTEPLEKVDREMLQNFFNINATSPLIVTQKFLPLLRQGAAQSKVPGFSLYRGAIVNVTTGYASLEGNTSGGIYAYRASKVALNMMTKSLSVDLQRDRILAVSLDPGWVQTDMGGSYAPLTVEDCVSRLLKVMESLTEMQNGRVISFKGKIVPF